VAERVDGEGAAGAVGVDAVGAVDATGQRVERAVVDAGGGEEAAVAGVVADVGVVGDDVGGVGVYRDGGGEDRLLPAGGGLVREGDGGEECAGTAPEVADVDAGVGRGLVEPHAGDNAGDVGAELHADFDRAGVGVGGGGRNRGAAEDGERPYRGG